MKILIAEDNQALQEMNEQLMNHFGYDFDIVSNGKEAIEYAQKNEGKYDLCIMDIDMPIMNGLEATEIITEALADTKILIFSMHESAEFVTNAVQAGASGYILKDTNSEEVYQAIKSVAQGKSYFSSSIAKMLIDNPPTQTSSRLTAREQMILSYIAKGQSSKEIAQTLTISFRTVEAHRRNIKSKLQLDSLAELVRYAVNQGLVNSE